jgi:hypothetical protein
MTAAIIGSANRKRQNAVACGPNSDSLKPIGAKPIATAPPSIMAGPIHERAGVAAGAVKQAIRCGSECRRQIRLPPAARQGSTNVIALGVTLAVRPGQQVHDADRSASAGRAVSEAGHECESTREDRRRESHGSRLATHHHARPIGDSLSAYPCVRGSRRRAILDALSSRVLCSIRRRCSTKTSRAKSSPSRSCEYFIESRQAKAFAARNALACFLVFAHAFCEAR